jgi:hypothetical protein
MLEPHIFSKIGYVQQLLFFFAEKCVLNLNNHLKKLISRLIEYQTASTKKSNTKKKKNKAQT